MDSLITLLAVVLGWFLNEVANLLRLGREDRRAAGPVLTNLLEIRHQLIAFDAFKSALSKELQIPAQAQLQLQVYIRALVPGPPGFIEKYEEAISTLSRVDPLRAFRLRGQPFIGPLLDHLRTLAASDRAGSEFWSTAFEPKLLAQIKPRLEELILDLAWAHGWRTWWRARRRLREPVLTQDDQRFISDLLTEVRKASGGPAGPQAAERETAATVKEEMPPQERQHS